MACAGTGHHWPYDCLPFPMWSKVGQMTSVYMSIACKQNTDHINAMMMEIDKETLNANFILIQLLAWEDIILKYGQGSKKSQLFTAGIYNETLHSDGLRSCDDVFLRLQCGCSWCWYSKGAREEFEMLRSLQPYLMCIAFGLTLLRWLKLTCFTVISIVWNMARGKLRKNLK
jgi:hypothetical protein